MTFILYTDFFDFSDKEFHKYFSLLPQPLQNRVVRFVKREDQVANVLGKMLLIEGLKMVNKSYNLSDLQYTRYQRPFFSQEVDFNISHSGSLVGCAISGDCSPLGLDIEQIQTIDLDDFTEIFTLAEMAMIKADMKPLDVFHGLWTKKEAVLKAKGMGLHFSPQQIAVCDDWATIPFGEKWHLSTLDLKDGYMASFASNHKEQYHLIKWDFSR